MIVAITGGTGFIGRHLIARHVARGDEVRYLTRKLPEKPIAGAVAVGGDLLDPASLTGLFGEGVDVLYHCAAELHDTEKMQACNVSGTENLLRAGRGKARRWVQLSSTGVYGFKPGCDVDEETPVNPQNAYERSKAQADDLVLAAMSAGDCYGVVLRPSNVYGSDMPNQSLFQLIRMVKRGWFFFVGQRRARVNYIPVENVVDALLLCATRELPANGRVYIVSDTGYLDDFIAAIARALGVSCPTRHLPEILLGLAARLGDRLPGCPLRSSRLDALTFQHSYKIDRIRRELGFENRIDMSEGISRLCQS